MTSALYSFRVLLVAIIAPAVVAIAAVALEIELAASGPSRVATHWDAAGNIDGYGSPFTYPILMASISVALITLLGGATVLSAHRRALTRVLKLLGIASLWVTVFLGATLTGSLLSQRTTDAVKAAPGPGLALLLGAALAIVAGVSGWYVMPKAVRLPVDSDLVIVAPVVLSEGERATWLRTASASRGVLVGFVIIGLVLGTLEITVVLLTGGRAWWIAIVPIVALSIALANLTFTVRVDSRGVRIRSAIGLPAFTIPLSNIVSANVVDVSAFAQYGGWGIRWNLSGRVGIILRSGPALEIHRKKGLVVVITIDDATSAAALVNGLVQRQATVA